MSDVDFLVKLRDALQMAAEKTVPLATPFPHFDDGLDLKKIYISLGGIQGTRWRSLCCSIDNREIEEIKSCEIYNFLTPLYLKIGGLYHA